MNTRVFLFAGLLATAAIAFSGVFTETTGLEITQGAQAICTEIPDPEDPVGKTTCAEKYYCPILYETLGRPCLR